MAVSILLAALLAAPDGPGFRREVRVVMGSTADIWVAGAADPTAALDAGFAELDQVDRSMSLWKESELTALNRTGRGQVSDGLFCVLEDAMMVASSSGGAF